MSTNSIGQNMMLITSSFRNVKSFSLIPVSNDSPYVEAMFDPSSSILAVISKIQKHTFHMLPRLDDDGNPMRLKNPNFEAGKTVKEQRVTLETYNEYYITDKVEIDLFIKMFAINAESFDYKQYFVDIQETKVSKIILDTK